jgi:hypothetical protein
MGWTDPSSHVYVVGEVVTAATLNTFVKDNLIDLDRRSSFVGGAVESQESTSSTAYTDLATVGPTVSVDVGQSGQLLVHVYASLSNNVANNAAHMSYAISGATAFGAGDGISIAYTPGADFRGARIGATFHHFGLNPGVHTVTAKYRVAGGTGQIGSRRIMVVPFGA